MTLLEWALLQQSKRALTTLLDAGADPSQPGIGGDTVLHLAAKVDDPSYLRLLLEHGADPNAPNGTTQAPPLDAALMNATDDAFDLLLAHHADPNRPDRVGNTPLHVSAEVHKTQCILQLLQEGADPTLRNSHGDTFQAYFNILPAGGLNAAGLAQHDAVHQWLRAHGVPVEGDEGS
ncbi:ankyrin repeat domain-containing protein [Catenulispora rubra]|uniref:ankyrin repeat domain-containing protein n=1 Tax=Catenulispora rubra TaxID=280293 RepID=UPI0018924F32|nr:ankyrin repeat domain-containing protein [Catenulispora rubra]